MRGRFLWFRPIAALGMRAASGFTSLYERAMCLSRERKEQSERGGYRRRASQLQSADFPTRAHRRARCFSDRVLPRVAAVAPRPSLISGSTSEEHHPSCDSKRKGCIRRLPGKARSIKAATPAQRASGVGIEKCSINQKRNVRHSPRTTTGIARSGFPDIAARPVPRQGQRSCGVRPVWARSCAAGRKGVCAPLQARPLQTHGIFAEAWWSG